MLLSKYMKTLYVSLTALALSTVPAFADCVSCCPSGTGGVSDWADAGMIWFLAIAAFLW
jgi:hypothetical protein